MKKIYYAPNLTVVKIETHRLMQASDGRLDKTQTIESAGDFGSRRSSSIWDDEEEDYDE